MNEQRPRSKELVLVPAQPDGTVWERLETETLPAFRNFAQYRDMGPHRSVRKLAKEVGKRPDSLFEQSRKYHWVRRCEDYDDMIDRRHREALEGERDRINRDGMRIARGMMLSGGRRLLGDAETAAIDPNSLDAQDVAKFIETGWRMARTASGQPTDVIRGLFQITSDDLNRIVQGVYEIGHMLMPDERKARHASLVQAFLEGGEIPQG